ncbi:MAG: hypothetical protein MI924_27615 [Chloroflexales bacterium]|nr:hypothetical protein [Chloroflexales bacterium]
MANESMTDEKRARLEAIRAANRNRKAAGTGEAAAPAVVETTPSPEVATPSSAQPATAGTAMSDEKAERLAAIRAANAAKKADPAPPAAAAAPPASTVAPATPKPATPAASAATKTPPLGQMATPSSRPLTIQKITARTIVGALCGMLMLGLLATTVGNILPALIFGAFIGAVVGYMFGSWPPSPGDETTE